MSELKKKVIFQGMLLKKKESNTERIAFNGQTQLHVESCHGRFKSKRLMSSETVAIITSGNVKLTGKNTEQEEKKKKTRPNLIK